MALNELGWVCSSFRARAWEMIYSSYVLDTVDDVRACVLEC